MRVLNVILVCGTLGWFPCMANPSDTDNLEGLWLGPKSKAGDKTVAGDCLVLKRLNNAGRYAIYMQARRPAAGACYLEGSLVTRNGHILFFEDGASESEESSVELSWTKSELRFSVLNRDAGNFCGAKLDLRDLRFPAHRRHGLVKGVDSGEKNVLAQLRSQCPSAN